MRFSYKDKSVRLTGRWDTTGECAVTTAPGAYVEFAFRGNMAVARFDIETNIAPFPHLWIQLDGKDMIEAPLDAYLRVNSKNDGGACLPNNIQRRRGSIQPLVCTPAR